MTRTSDTAWRVAQASLVALVAVGLAWELWLAPLRPGGSWLALKVLPIALTLPGVLRRQVMPLQWALLATPLYIAEAAVRLADPWPNPACAAAELVCALAFFGAAIAVLRPLKRAARQRQRDREAAEAALRGRSAPGP